MSLFMMTNDKLQSVKRYQNRILHVNDVIFILIGPAIRVQSVKNENACLFSTRYRLFDMIRAIRQHGNAYKIHHGYILTHCITQTAKPGISKEKGTEKLI